MKHYTCHCGAFAKEDDVTVTRHPNVDEDMGKTFDEIDARHGRDLAPKLPYHQKQIKGRGFGGCACCVGYKNILCGPMHEETLEEAYVRMAFGNTEKA